MTKCTPRYVWDPVGGPQRVAIAFMCCLVFVVTEHMLWPASQHTLHGGGAKYVESDDFFVSGGNQGVRRLRSYGGRSYSRHKSAKDALIDALCGPILWFMAATILFVNEGRHVKMQALLSVANRSVKDLDESNEPPETGTLVHVTGTLSSPSRPCHDELFPQVEAPVNAVKLRRQAEMYQWIEEKKEKDGRDYYSYKQDWSPTYHDSSKFDDQQHQNPPPPRTSAGTPVFRESGYGIEDGKGVSYGENVKIRDYRATPRVLGKLHSWKSLTTNPDALRLQGPYAAPMTKGKRNGDTEIECIYWKFNQGPKGADEVGDVRITYEYVQACEVSITAVLDTDSFTPMKYKDLSSDQAFCSEWSTSKYQLVRAPTADGSHLEGADDFEDEPGIFDDVMRGLGALKQALTKDTCVKYYCCCTSCGLGIAFFDAAAPAEIFIVTEGKKSLEDNLATSRSEAGYMLIFMRIFGLLLMWGSLKMLFSPIIVILAYIPFIGPLFIGLISCCTCLCATGCGLTIMSVAWVFYRPLVGSAIMATTIAIWLLIGHFAEQQMGEAEAFSTTFSAAISTTMAAGANMIASDGEFSPDGSSGSTAGVAAVSTTLNAIFATTAATALDTAAQGGALRGVNSFMSTTQAVANKLMSTALTAKESNALASDGTLTDIEEMEKNVQTFIDPGKTELASTTISYR